MNPPMNSKLDDQTGDFLMESPYTDSVKGVISSVMLMVSGIKNKYGCPVVNPPEMNQELSAVYEKAKALINQQIKSVLDELEGEVIGEDEPHYDTDRTTQNAQRQRNLLRAEQRQTIQKIRSRHE